MIHGIQRAHSRTQTFFLMIPAILPFVGLIMTFIYREVSWGGWLSLCFTSVFCYTLFMYNIRHVKQVFYDQSYIYIKSFFGKDEHCISYHAVIELKDKKPRFWNKSQRGPIRLTYFTSKGSVKIRFYRSFYQRQTDLFKRQISPEKVIERQ